VSPTFGTDASGVQIKITTLLTSSIFDALIYSSVLLNGRSFFDVWVWNNVKIAME
jgi:hypothetical protein